MRFLITLVIFFLAGTVNSIAADCADVDGTTVTITTDCSGRLEVTGDSSNITIDSGVNVSGQTDNNRFAIETTDGTNTTITVNGSIGTRETSDGVQRYSIYHHTGSGSITAINNNGTMGVYENGASSLGTVIHNKSTIGNINNAASGTMTSNGRNTIVNGAGGTITKIDNDGTIESDNKWTIKNITGHIGEIDNSGTIEAGANGISISAENAEAAIRNYGVGEITTITNSGLISANEQTIQNEAGAVIGTINNTASGTIRAKGKDQQAIRVHGSGSIIQTITNAGAIEATINNEHADRGTIRVADGGEITTITNSGTISGLGAQSVGTIWVGEDAGTTIGTITNSGDITSRSKEGSINNHGTIGIINNSGNITNTNSDTESAGIRNADSGTITTITNTGTIAGANVDIRNADTGGNSGTIVTLNNDQGGNDALTYSHALPTNYNVIINSESDYGKIVFSDSSGTLNFNIHESSTIVKGATYSSIMSGIDSSYLNATTGYLLVDNIRTDWTLSNSGNTWSVSIADDDPVNISPPTNEAIEQSVVPNITDNFNDLNSVIEVNFANMNTYDCDFFGEKNICLSIGARRTNVSNPDTTTDGGVIVGGYQFSDNLRFGAFYHSNLSSDTPARFKLSDKTPLLGALVVWNQKANKMGWQVKVANAFQQKNATLIREIVDSSERGIGKTQTEAKSIVVEFQYGYPLYDKYIVINPHLAFYTIMHPYIAFRKSENTQDAYTETGISTPITYNEIKDEMTTVLVGLKFDTEDSFLFSNNFSRNLSIKGSIGLEHDLSHSVTTLKPTGMSGLENVSLTDKFNKTRPVVSLGFDYLLKKDLRFSGLAQFQELPYQNKEETNYYFKITQAF